MDENKSNSDAIFRNQVLESFATVTSKLAEIELNGRASTDEVWHEPRNDKRKIFARVRCNVITVGEIDTVKQQFDAELFLGVTYKEPLVKGLIREDVDWDKMWSPRIVFTNAEEIKKMECKHRIKPADDEHGEPDVYFTYRLRATFKTSMYLKTFPVDFQKLSIKLMSDWPETDVEFVKDTNIKDSIRMDTFSGSHEWELIPAVSAAPIKGNREESSSHRVYPVYHISMYAKRKGLYYFWNLTLVLMLIISLSFASFAVAADQPEDRLSVTLTLLLTAVAFKYVAAQSLPPISYLTLLDKYVIFCLVFQCIAVCQNAVASVFTTPESIMLFDTISACVMVGVLILGHLITVIYLYIANRKTHSIIQNAIKEYKELNVKIDKMRQVRKEAERKKQEVKTVPADDVHKKTKRGKRLKRNKVDATDKKELLGEGSEPSQYSGEQ
ncbi:uncharacterized protein LOC117288467 [Asterias rubens]|uniref:uncharacterized protein LOC117288467 n=1 Tax=Asterias rubens TaxID=7604 RepID=UPI001455A1B6|nr:uncharacterized protein LOC117288467 [Asterias rubens]